nr:hypothetical protein CFP56_12592 [Quercus suber]
MGDRLRLKKRKLGDEKAEVSLRPSTHIAPPSLTISLEVIAISPPVTCARGKSKIGMNVWDNPATALGRAHNVITTDELKNLSSIPSHELVSCHIHKLVQVKELTESLHVEKAFVIQKDKEIQASLLKTDEERENVIRKFKLLEEFSNLQFLQYIKGFELLHRWTMKHHSLVVDFSSLDFEKIDIEVLEDGAKELEEAESGVLEKDKAAEDMEDDGADKVVDKPLTLPA